MKTISKDSSDGFRYFILLTLAVLFLAAIALFAKPGYSSNTMAVLADSLNSASLVYFDFGSSELKPESFDILNTLAGTLKKTPGAKIHVTGYTDDIGSDGFNLNLSLMRAESVKNYLVSLGCDPSQITTEAKGKIEPLNNNSNEQERKLNRRVAFSIDAPLITEQPKDEEFVNTSLKKTERTEIEAVISARDTAGEPISGIEEKDVSAKLRWGSDSAEGTVHFIPIDDKKKMAYSIVLDYSGSMFGISKTNKDVTKSDKVLKMENAVKSFIETLPSNALLQVIKFGSDIDVVRPYTRSKNLMISAVDTRSYSRESTALFAAIYRALTDTMYDSNPTIMKTIIAFTDGMDNSSGKIKKDSIYRRSDKKAVKIYTIGLLDRNTTDITEEERIHGEKDLKEISAETGGFFYNADNAESLKKIYNQISAQIMNSYHISVKWNESNLPPKGTKVTACITVTIKAVVRTIYKDYIMD